jgi:predicted cupin superfamily sugar epimerase
MVSAREIAEQLGLESLPDEGGLFRRTFADDHSSAIYYLLAGSDFSALHVLTVAETYHHYAGAPLQMLLLHPDGSVERPVLGTDLAAGQRPQLVVPAGTWQGSRPAGEWVLVGTTMAPPFEWGMFTLGQRAELQAQYRAAAADIAALTRA